MKIPGLARLRRASPWHGARREAGAIILLYHRVAAVATDPWGMCVSPEHFSEHLEVLREHFVPARLQELCEISPDSRLKKRYVALTLDDGYSDALGNAQPVLERNDVPATVFVVTGGLERKQEFWWDELERLLLQPGRLPETLSLKIQRKDFGWHLGESAYYGEAEYRNHRQWSARDGHSPSPRHALYRALHEALRPLTQDERAEVLGELRQWADAEMIRRPTHRRLSIRELVDLGRKALIEVGAHSVTHPWLPSLPVALQKKEVEESKETLEGILGARVTSFAYPYGSFTIETTRVVRDAGFTRACCSKKGTLHRGNDAFQLPRIEVPDLDGDQFASWISTWLPE